MNWYNFQNTWPQVPGGQVDLKSPSVAAVIPASAAGTGECPTGLCPTGASCSQLAGQWQCACGQNGCSGSEFLLLILLEMIMFENRKKEKRERGNLMQSYENNQIEISFFDFMNQSKVSINEDFL